MCINISMLKELDWDMCMLKLEQEPEVVIPYHVLTQELAAVLVRIEIQGNPYLKSRVVDIIGNIESRLVRGQNR